MIAKAQSFVECISRSRNNAIYLVIAPDDTERKAWYFIQVDKMKLPLFEKAMQAPGAELGRYGDVLASGYGDAPPAFVVEHMKVQYGVAMPEPVA